MLQFIKKVVIYVKINDNLFHYFEAAGTRVNYKPHDLIYMQEDYTNCLYLILKGRVRVFNITSAGDEITYEVLEKGRIFGESSFFQNSSRPTNVEAITDVELISVYLSDLYPYLSQSSELSIALLKLLSHTCDYLTDLLKKAYTYDRYEKIASFLLDQSIDNIDKGIINQTIPYTHEEIATVVGLSRVTVSNVLREFVKKGYIENKYKKIIILNRNDLSDILPPLRKT